MYINVYRTVEPFSMGYWYRWGPAYRYRSTALLMRRTHGLHEVCVGLMQVDIIHTRDIEGSKRPYKPRGEQA